MVAFSLLLSKMRPIIQERIRLWSKFQQYCRERRGKCRQWLRCDQKKTTSPPKVRGNMRIWWSSSSSIRRDRLVLDNPTRQASPVTHKLADESFRRLCAVVQRELRRSWSLQDGMVIYNLEVSLQLPSLSPSELKSQSLENNFRQLLKPR